MLSATPQRLLREQFRKYLTAGLEPLTQRLEAGEELPYAFMREMVSDLGLAEAFDDVEAEDRELARQAHTQLMVEISRINPGFGMSYGTSADLCAGNAEVAVNDELDREPQPRVPTPHQDAGIVIERGVGADGRPLHTGTSL